MFNLSHFGIAFTPEGNYAYVTNTEDNTVSDRNNY